MNEIVGPFPARIRPACTIESRTLALTTTAQLAALPAVKGAQACTARFPRGQFLFGKACFRLGPGVSDPLPRAELGRAPHHSSFKVSKTHNELGSAYGSDIR